MNKEQVYDTILNPLVAQIMEVCQHHGIAMVASFAIPTPENDALACTSVLPDQDGKGHPLSPYALRFARTGSVEPTAFAITITSPKQ